MNEEPERETVESLVFSAYKRRETAVHGMARDGGMHGMAFFVSKLHNRNREEEQDSFVCHRQVTRLGQNKQHLFGTSNTVSRTRPQSRLNKKKTRKPKSSVKIQNSHQHQSPPCRQLGKTENRKCNITKKKDLARGD